jgi:hypothetical protein
MAGSSQHRRSHSAAPSGRSGKSDLYVWTIVILLLIGLAIASWIGSFYIFGHPEKAASYAILSRLGKVDPPKRFELTAAPRGEFLNPPKLLERFGGMSPGELERSSERLLRDYIRNYRLAPELVPYVVGEFAILDSYELGPSNFVPGGVVALAQAKDDPTVLIEHIFPADPKVVPILQRMLLTGLDLQLNRGIDLSATLHARKLADGRLLVTAIPLLYGSYATTAGPGTFSLEPPTALNVAGGLPVLNASQIGEATAKYAAYLKRAGLPATASAPSRPSQQLMRVERPQAATAAAAVTPAPTPLPMQEPTPASVLAEVVASPTPEATPTASPTPSPAGIASTAGGAWPVYGPGQMPRGRLLNMQDVGDLAERGVGAERVYLQGSFVVTASGGNRAVLRAQAALTDALGIRGRKTKVRVIAEFPTGAKPPSEGSAFSRDSMRPFQITDVRTGEDGQVNVFVREVTR